MTRLAFGILLLASVASAGKRDALAKAFLGYLTAQKITFTVVEQTDDRLVLAVGDAKPAIALDNLEQHIADDVAGGATEAKARAAIFQKYGTRCERWRGRRCRSR